MRGMVDGDLPACARPALVHRVAACTGVLRPRHPVHARAFSEGPTALAFSVHCRRHS